jgi:hypothetical protein
MLSQNFRPSLEGLDYFENDLSEIMINQLGMSNQQEYTIKSIDWYDWDNSPRWFVMVHIYGRSDKGWGKVGYTELDVYAYESGDEVHIDRVEIPGHGYPCSSTLVAERIGDDFDWNINQVFY